MGGTKKWSSKGRMVTGNGVQAAGTVKSNATRYKELELCRKAAEFDWSSGGGWEVEA